VRQRLNSSEAHFLLAYQYLTCGHQEAAAKQLKTVLSLTPGDPLVKQLLGMTGESETGVIEATPPQPGTGGKKPTAEQLIGKWTAPGPDNATFNMVLNQDGSFQWKFTRDGKSQSVSGVYAFEDNVLALEPDSDGGNVMTAGVGIEPDGSLSFLILGGDPSDPGLKFKRAQGA
jgi:hypothetical protein